LGPKAYCALFAECEYRPLSGYSVYLSKAKVEEPTTLTTIALPNPVPLWTEGGCKTPYVGTWKSMGHGYDLKTCSEACNKYDWCNYTYMGPAAYCALFAECEYRPLSGYSVYLSKAEVEDSSPTLTGLVKGLVSQTQELETSVKVLEAAQTKDQS